MISHQFFQAPIFFDPYYDSRGKKSHDFGVTPLSLEARLHNPKAVFEPDRTCQENLDLQRDRIRKNDCLM